MLEDDIEEEVDDGGPVAEIVLEVVLKAALEDALAEIAAMSCSGGGALKVNCVGFPQVTVEFSSVPQHCHRFVSYE